MSTTRPPVYQNLSMQNFLYGLFNLLGGKASTLGSRGERLSSYEHKRDFVSDKMLTSVRSLFAGNYWFEDEKNLNPEASKHTEDMFDYLFERVETFIFLMQKDADACYYSGAKFPVGVYVCVAVAVVSQGLINDHGCVKTCPFLYFRDSLNEILSNGLNLEKSLRKIIFRELDEIRGGLSRKRFSIYEKINKIDRNKIASKSSLSIYLDMKELREDLCCNGFNEEFINGFVDELHGRYNSFVFLAKLKKYIYEINDGGGGSDLFKDLSYFILTYDVALSFNDDFSGMRSLSLDYFSDGLAVDFGFESAKSFKAFYRIYSRVFDCFWNGRGDLFYNHIVFEKYHSQYFSGIFLSLFDLRNKNIDAIIGNYKYIEKDCCFSRDVINCLEYIKKNKRVEAINIIERLLVVSDDVPYSTIRIISLLHVGICSSDGFKNRNNSFSKSLDCYLKNSMPEFDVYPISEERCEVDFIEKYQNDKYNSNYGMIRLIGEYNGFVFFNGLEFEGMVANPLDSMNFFLDGFFHGFDNFHGESNEKERIKLSLKGLKTPLRKARIPGVDFDIFDLKSRFILQLLSLGSGSVQGYQGTAAIERFLSLSKTTRQTIFEACEELLAT